MNAAALVPHHRARRVDWPIGLTFGGSGAEIINHCCDPNLRCAIVRGHIIYFAKRDIEAGEELTIDYRFDSYIEKIPCSCGSKKCRGVINVK